MHPKIVSPITSVADNPDVGHASNSSRVWAVVLNWNSRLMTSECLRSLRAMTEAETLRIVVIDNGSTDDSVSLLRREFPEIEIIANDRNLGFAGGCNVGIRRALQEGADYVLLINNDTVVEPSLLRELLKEADKQPRAGILSPKIYYFEPSDVFWWVGGTFNRWTGLTNHIDLRDKERGNHDQARDLDWATGCVMLLRSEALRTVGLFDEQLFFTGEDVDLSLRMKNAGFSIRFVPSARLWHKESVDMRKNAGQHVRSFMMVRNLLWVMHKHARSYHWIIFWPVFFGYFLPKMFFVTARTGDFRSSASMVQAVFAFWRMLLTPGTSILPREMQASTVPRRRTAEEAISKLNPL